MVRQKILLPYNFGANDEKALDFVVRRFAGDRNTEITLFKTYDPVPEFDVRSNPVMEKMNFNLSYLRQKINEEEERLRHTAEKLKKSGFADEQVHYIFKARKKDVAGDIVDLILAENFDTVVLNRNPARITRFFTKSVSDKVTARLRKDIAVFIIT